MKYLPPRWLCPMSCRNVFFPFAHVAPKLPLNRRHNPRAILRIIILDGSRTGKPRFLNRGGGDRMSSPHFYYCHSFTTFPREFEYSLRKMQLVQSYSERPVFAAISKMQPVQLFGHFCRRSLQTHVKIKHIVNLTPFPWCLPEAASATSAPSFFVEGPCRCT